MVAQGNKLAAFTEIVPMWQCPSPFKTLTTAKKKIPAYPITPECHCVIYILFHTGWTLTLKPDGHTLWALY